MALFSGLRFEDELAGLVAWSGYLLLPDRLEAEASPGNRRVPILQGHGLVDTQVPIELGLRARDRLRELGWPVQWHQQPAGHTVEWEMVDRLAQWLIEVLPRQR